MARPRRKRLEETNARCGRLLVLAFNDSKYYCLCDCGTRKWIRASNVERGVTKSCGCLMKDFCGRKKFPSLTEQDKMFIDKFWTPNHPVFGYLGIARILKKEPHTIEYYIKKIGRQPKHLNAPEKIHIWEPVRGCGYNRVICMLKNRQSMPNPIQLRQPLLLTALNPGESLSAPLSAVLIPETNKNEGNDRLEPGIST